MKLKSRKFLEQNIWLNLCDSGLDEDFLDKTQKYNPKRNEKW